VFFSSVVTSHLDKQGRLTIPLELREYAGLERDLAIVGLSGRMEIWNAETWKTYLDYHEPDYSSLHEGVR
jgi:MraZ protein